MFKAIIDFFTTLKLVQTFSYLKKILEVEPSTLIANLEKTAANYISELESLKEGYGDKHRIFDTHYRETTYRGPKDREIHHFKQYFDTLELHIRELEAQNKKKE